MDIIERVRQQVLASGDFLNVIIAGATCSGKTTLADKLELELRGDFSVSIVRQDAYFKDIGDIPKVRQGYLYDSINAFHTQEFRQDVESMLKSGTTLTPRYNVSRNIRIAKDVCVKFSKINIFEGLHVIQLLSDLPNRLTVFLNTPIEVCLERRIARDTIKYNVPEQRIREYFSDCILPMYQSYIAPQKRYADIILEGSG